MKTVRTKSGRVLGTDDLDRIADNLEAGFPAAAWWPPPGHPQGATDAHSGGGSEKLPKRQLSER
jgi:hypothetical protein